MVCAHEPFSALASPLPAAVPTTLSASTAYHKHNLVDWGAVAITCAWGIPATVAGSWASQLAGGHRLMELTALFVIGLGVAVLRSSHEDQEDAEAQTVKYTLFGPLTGIALSVGFLSGLLANTGGILYAPLFMMLLCMPVKRALATSLIVSAVLAVPGTISHWYLGHIDWKLVAALSVGTIPFSYLGAQLAIRLRSATLVKVYGVMLTLFGFYDLLYTERAHLPFGWFR
ncbi:MAG TPA: sulfite exporter TauE/SafE family protein [Thermoanaerobaculaceae bacterium]|nr:sulfite exporter TauE/SafE family protein [Thermoanaerobaculaceae bacterium]